MNKLSDWGIHEKSIGDSGSSSPLPDPGLTACEKIQKRDKDDHCYLVRICTVLVSLE